MYIEPDVLIKVGVRSRFCVSICYAIRETCFIVVAHSLSTLLGVQDVPTGSTLKAISSWPNNGANIKAAPPRRRNPDSPAAGKQD